MVEKATWETKNVEKNMLCNKPGSITTTTQIPLLVFESSLIYYLSVINTTTTNTNTTTNTHTTTIQY